MVSGRTVRFLSKMGLKFSSQELDMFLTMSFLECFLRYLASIDDSRTELLMELLERRVRIPANHASLTKDWRHFLGQWSFQHAYNGLFGLQIMSSRSRITRHDRLWNDVGHSLSWTLQTLAVCRRFVHEAFSRQRNQLARTSCLRQILARLTKNLALSNDENESYQLIPLEHVIRNGVRVYLKLIIVHLLAIEH